MLNWQDLADDIVQASNLLLSGDYEVNAERVEIPFRNIEVQEIRDAFAKINHQRALGLIKYISIF